MAPACMIRLYLTRACLCFVGHAGTSRISRLVRGAVFACLCSPPYVVGEGETSSALGWWLSRDRQRGPASRSLLSSRARNPPRKLKLLPPRGVIKTQARESSRPLRTDPWIEGHPDAPGRGTPFEGRRRIPREGYLTRASPVRGMADPWAPICARRRSAVRGSGRIGRVALPPGGTADGADGPTGREKPKGR